MGSHGKRSADPVTAIQICGILNLTPDSFYDGGRFATDDMVIQRAIELEAEGADIIDIGAESSRPGSRPISEDAEMARLAVVPKIRDAVNCELSLDTTKPAVAKWGLSHGISIINDITGLTNPGMRDVIQGSDAGVIIMHMRNTPIDMQANPVYGDVVSDVADALAKGVAAAKSVGIQRIWVDPGIGFGKTVAHNCALIRAIPTLGRLSPVCIGVSRKSFIGELTGAAVSDRLPGTIAATIMAAQYGVQMVRVHDVMATRQAISVWNAVR